MYISLFFFFGRCVHLKRQLFRPPSFLSYLKFTFRNEGSFFFFLAKKETKAVCLRVYVPGTGFGFISVFFFSDIYLYR